MAQVALDEDDFAEIKLSGNNASVDDEMLRRAAENIEDPEERAKYEKWMQKQQEFVESRPSVGGQSSAAAPNTAAVEAYQQGMAQSGALSAEELKQQHARNKEAEAQAIQSAQAADAQRQRKAANDQAALDASRKAVKDADLDDEGGRKPPRSAISGRSHEDKMWTGKPPPEVEAKAKAEADAAAAAEAAAAAAAANAAAEAQATKAAAAAAAKRAADKTAAVASATAGMSPEQAYKHGLKMAAGEVEKEQQGAAAMENERREREAQLAAGMEAYEDALDNRGDSSAGLLPSNIPSKGADISGRSIDDKMWVGKPPPPKPPPSGVLRGLNADVNVSANVGGAPDLTPAQRAYEQGMAQAAGEIAGALAPLSSPATTVSSAQEAYAAGLQQTVSSPDVVAAEQAKLNAEIDADRTAMANVSSPGASAVASGAVSAGASLSHAPVASASADLNSASASAAVSPQARLASASASVATTPPPACRSSVSQPPASPQQDLEVQRQQQLVTSLQDEIRRMKDLNKAAEARTQQAEAALQAMVDKTEGRRLAPMAQSAGATGAVSSPVPDLRQSWSAGQCSAVQTDFKSSVKMHNESDELEKVRYELELALNRAAVAETHLDEQQHQLAQMRLSLGKELKSKGLMVGSDRAAWEHAVTQTIIEQQKHANRMIQKYVSKEETATLELDALKAKVTALVQQNTDFLHEINKLRAIVNPEAGDLQPEHSLFGAVSTTPVAERKVPTVATPIALQAQGIAEDTYSNAVYEDVLNKSRLERLLENAKYTEEVNKAQFEANEALMKQKLDAEPKLTHPLQNTRFALAKEKSRALASSLKREIFEVGSPHI